MTSYHKLGLGGLYLTLCAFEKNPRLIESFGDKGWSWKRSPTAVCFRLEKEPNLFFQQLVSESFKLRDGLFAFPALGDPMQSPEYAACLHEGILQTILQHGLTREAEPPKKGTGHLVFEYEDGYETIHYRKVKSYVHQRAVIDVSTPFSVAGWGFPGGAVRHTAFTKDTELREPLERALCLLFAIVGALYFRLRGRGAGVRANYALVIPEITNLEQYRSMRSQFGRFGAERFLVAGRAEAGLQVLLELDAQGLLQEFHGAVCRVVLLSTLPWSKQQKTRADVLALGKIPEQCLRVYRLCKQGFRSRLVRHPETGETFWSVPQSPALIAENLSKGKLSWWDGFADFSSDKERAKAIFSKEQGGLYRMVTNEQAMPKDSPQTIFVAACHEAWKRRLGKIGERARSANLDFSRQVSKEFEKLRVTFSRAKNAATLRAAITDFWVRGGTGLGPLQGDGWRKILPLLDDWSQARDLVLLALASYQPTTKEEAVALAMTDPQASDAPEMDSQESETSEE